MITAVIAGKSLNGELLNNQPYTVEMRETHDEFDSRTVRLNVCTTFRDNIFMSMITFRWMHCTMKNFFNYIVVRILEVQQRR